MIRLNLHDCLGEFHGGGDEGLSKACDSSGNEERFERIRIFELAMDTSLDPKHHRVDEGKSKQRGRYTRVQTDWRVLLDDFKEAVKRASVHFVARILALEFYFDGVKGMTDYHSGNTS